MAFVVFEGGEASGKSTQLNLLHEALSNLGKNCLVTREPGGTPLAENIRNLFKAVPEHGDAPLPLTELALVMAARAQHFGKVIQPALQQKSWILCDRFLDSSYVYQCYKGGVKKEVADAFASAILNQTIPDLTLVFSVSVQVSRQRIESRNRDTNASGKQIVADRLDSFDDAAFQTLENGFQWLLNENIPYPCGKVPKRILIDGSASVADIHKQILKIISEHFNLN